MRTTNRDARSQNPIALLWLASLTLMLSLVGGCEPPPWAEEGSAPSPSSPAPSAPAPESCLDDLALSEGDTLLDADGLQTPWRGYGPASSAVAFAGDLLLLVDEDSDELIALNAAGAIAFRLSTGPVPHHVVVEPTSGFAVVSLRGGRTLQLFDLHRRELAHTLEVGDEPLGLAAIGEGQVAVALGAQAEVVIIEVAETDAAQTRVTRRIRVPDDPTAVAMDARGEVFVTHLTGERLTRLPPGFVVGASTGPGDEEGPARLSVAQVDLRGIFVNPYDVANSLREGWARWWPHVGGARSLTVTHDGVVAVHALADIDPTRGGASTDCPYYGCADPDVPAALEPGRIVVDEHGNVTTRPETGIAPPDPLFFSEAVGGSCRCSFRTGLGSPTGSLECVDEAGNGRRGIDFAIGEGVTGVAVHPDGRSIWTWSAFDDLLTRIDLDGSDNVETLSLQLHSKLTDEEQLGRRLFHRADDVRTNSRGRLSCAGCHPGGRADGFTWQFPFGPRNTPQLGGGITDTAPFHWAGDVPTFQHLSVVTIETMMGGTGLSDAEMAAIAAYVDTLPAARLSKERLMPENAPSAPTPDEEPIDVDVALERGRAVFMDPAVGCTACHAGEDFTSAENIDLRAGEGSPSLSNPLQVPVLHGLGRSEPYLHDGSIPTLKILVEEWVATDRMGTGSHLTEAQLDDLVVFLRSL